MVRLSIIQIVVVVLLSIVVATFLFRRQTEEQTGGANPLSLAWSYLDKDISQGNPISTANRVNPIVYNDKHYKEPVKHFYFGTPVPLLHQMKGMSAPKDTMFYFANAKFSPECCQGGAPYSTSSGCVCAFPKQIYPCNTNKPYETPIPGLNSWLETSCSLQSDLVTN